MPVVKVDDITGMVVYVVKVDSSILLVLKYVLHGTVARQEYHCTHIEVEELVPRLVQMTGFTYDDHILIKAPQSYAIAISISMPGTKKVLVRGAWRQRNGSSK